MENRMIEVPIRDLRDLLDLSATAVEEMRAVSASPELVDALRGANAQVRSWMPVLIGA